MKRFISLKSLQSNAALTHRIKTFMKSTLECHSKLEFLHVNSRHVNLLDFMGTGWSVFCTVQYYSMCIIVSEDVGGFTSEVHSVYICRRDVFLLWSAKFLLTCDVVHRQQLGGQKLEISTKISICTNQSGVTQGGSVLRYNCQIMLFTYLQSFEFWRLHSNRSVECEF